MVGCFLYKMPNQQSKSQSVFIYYAMTNKSPLNTQNKHTFGIFAWLVTESIDPNHWQKICFQSTNWLIDISLQL